MTSPPALTSVSFLKAQYVRNTFRDFLYIWHKHVLGGDGWFIIVLHLLPGYHVVCLTAESGTTVLFWVCVVA